VGIVEEGANNFLGTGDLLGVCWTGCIWKWGILDVLVISWDCQVVWGILWTIGRGCTVYRLMIIAGIEREERRVSELLIHNRLTEYAASLS
jgi:hypothetical protein